MMSMYKTFKTDPELEKRGIVIDYGSFRVTVSRVGGANKRFAKVLEARTKPYRRAIQTDMMERERLVAIVRETFAETNVLNWEVNVGTEDEPEWKQGIEGEDGSLLPFTKDNVLKVLTDLTDLYDDLQEQANKAALFRETVMEEDAKN